MRIRLLLYWWMSAGLAWIGHTSLQGGQVSHGVPDRHVPPLVISVKIIEFGREAGRERTLAEPRIVVNSGHPGGLRLGNDSTIRIDIKRETRFGWLSTITVERPRLARGKISYEEQRYLRMLGRGTESIVVCDPDDRVSGARVVFGEVRPMTREEIVNAGFRPHDDDQQ